MKAKITHYLIPLLILTIIITFYSFSCSTPGPAAQAIEEPVEEPEPNIALEIVELAKSQIGNLTGDGAFAGLVWADSNYTYCDRFVSAVMAVASVKPLSERKSYPTAYDDYIAHEDLIKSGEPPKGAVVYLDKHAENTYNGVAYGHVGISDGEGNIISVVDKARGVLSVPLKNFKAPLLGWITFKEYKSQEEIVEEVTGEAEEALDESEAEEIVEEVIDIDEFIGSWRNLDPDTRHITKVQIRMENNEIFIHMWGKCHPEDCDWGEEKPESYDSKSRTIFMTWKTGFSIISQQINLLSDGNLQVNSHTHFIDESNRADYDSLSIFYKVTNNE